MKLTAQNPHNITSTVLRQFNSFSSFRLLIYKFLAGIDRICTGVDADESCVLFRPTVSVIASIRVERS